MISPPIYVGYIDFIKANKTIVGWAASVGQNLSIAVELIADGHVVAQSQANEYREDVRDAGHGTGNHGFSLEIPDFLMDGQQHSIYIRIKHTDFRIEGNLDATYVGSGATKSSPEITSEAADLNNPAISIIMPTYNRGDMMELTVTRLIECAKKIAIEIIIIDDGSTDDTPNRLKKLSELHSVVKYESVPNGGPGKARNKAALMARSDILLFIGDDVIPTTDDFLDLHLAAHTRFPRRGQAVLGKITWPDSCDFDVNFVMSHIQGEGQQQFGYRYMKPYTWYGWNLFYSSNISVKRNLVSDWSADGFSEAFYLAAFEDPELGFRTAKRLAEEGEKLEVFYLAAASLAHYHKYDVESFLRRQVSAGMMASEFIKLHPGSESDLGLDTLNLRLSDLSVGRDFPVEHYMNVLEGLRSWAIIIDNHYGLGSQNWHADLLATVFRVAYLEGYIRAQMNSNINIPSAYRYILENVRTTLDRAIVSEILGDNSNIGLI